MTPKPELILKRGIIFILGLVLMAPLAGATSISFDCITNNNSTNAAVGEAQLSVTVSDAGSGNVLFTFFNVGSAACSITDIYFDNGSPAKTLSSIASLINGTGVSFSPNASPSNLPGGQLATPQFVVSAGLSADSDAPTQPKGVNPGETLGVTFSLVSGKTFESVVAALTSGDLRLGIHVQGFSNGGSERLVSINKPNPSMVPEPTTMGLVTLGMLSLASIKRRRSA